MNLVYGLKPKYRGGLTRKLVDRHPIATGWLLADICSYDPYLRRAGGPNVPTFIEICGLKFSVPSTRE